MALLEAHNLTKHFGVLAAVNRIDLTGHDGEIVGRIGPNVAVCNKCWPRPGR